MLQSSHIPSLVCVYSEYLEVHQTELDKLTTQLKDMKRNSRLVRVTLFHRAEAQEPSRGAGAARGWERDIGNLH